MQRELVTIHSGSTVEGMLELPPGPLGIVLFAHGSGSSRFSTRNNFVADQLRKAKIATLLMDLLTPREDQDYQTRFDIALLTRRLHAAADWLTQDSRTSTLAVGLFGASTGAAAALQVAATRTDVAAVVSRGGRPDLAGESLLGSVQAPTLLIVGGLDTTVLGLNRMAYAALRCEKHLEIVPGATHLFEEPGTLDAVAALAADWFVRHMGTRSRAG
jgi:putative phosphoribosyl transferase